MSHFGWLNNRRVQVIQRLAKYPWVGGGRLFERSLRSFLGRPQPERSGMLVSPALETSLCLLDPTPVPSNGFRYRDLRHKDL